MEDDIVLTNNFNTIINKYKHRFNINEEAEIFWLGYTQYVNKESSSKKVIIKPLEINNYAGGFFCYIINKTAAKILVDYINTNGITRGIDFLIFLVNNINFYQLSSHIAHTEWVRTPEKDSDIQNDYEQIDLDKNFIDERFIFLPHQDQSGYDILNKKSKLDVLLLEAINNDNVCAVNTNGWFKNKLVNIEKTEWFPNEQQGLYVKKEAYEKYNNLKYNNSLNTKIVSSQCNVSNEIAQDILLKYDGDIVLSIIELSKSQ
jgi:GR25 family glycosyltransferase involved in LPS biosynthesis